MVYTAIGALFIMTFGVGIAYDSVFGNGSETNPVVGNWLAESSDPEFLEGHPVKVNATGHLIPITDTVHYDDLLDHEPVEHDLPVPPNARAKHKAILFMALIIIRKYTGDLSILPIIKGSFNPPLPCSRLLRPILPECLARKIDNSWRDEHRGMHQQVRGKEIHPDRKGLQESLRFRSQRELEAFPGSSEWKDVLEARPVTVWAFAAWQWTGVGDCTRYQLKDRVIP